MEMQLRQAQGAEIDWRNRCRGEQLVDSIGLVEGWCGLDAEEAAEASLMEIDELHGQLAHSR